MANQLVSIIMPIWNGEPWLEQAVDSVIKQEHQHWELLLIDNGSTDRSWELIHGYSDPRIRIFQQSHDGVSSARNLGLDQAKGNYICFLDCDDQLPPKSLKARIARFEHHADIGFVDGKVEVWNHDFTLQTNTYTPQFTGLPLNELRTLSGACFYGITWMIRATAIKHHRFPLSMSHSEDLAFFASLADSHWKYSAVEVPVYQVRKRPHSAMSNLDGLATGYQMLFAHLQSLRPKETEWQTCFRSKVRRILFRSYLKKFQIVAALRSWLRWS